MSKILKTFIAVLPGHVNAEYTGGYVMEARGEEIPRTPDSWELVMRSLTQAQLLDTEKVVHIDAATFEVFEVISDGDDATDRPDFDQHYYQSLEGAQS